MAAASEIDQLRDRVERHRLWYHTIELAAGVVTPGWFDLRPIVERMPWPDVRGRRCLDVGTWDGFLAFELERRGAAEVVATDIADPSGWDWPRATRERDVRGVAATVGEATGAGFEIAREALGSSVERIEVSAYDLEPGLVGSFDVVVCGSLMLHLRDPVAALEAIATVCDGELLSAEQIRVDLSLLHRRRPAAHFMGGKNCQWWVPNVSGHAEMLRAAGFEIARRARPYAIPLGLGHPERDSAGPRRAALDRIVTRGTGLPHSAVLASAR